MPVPVTIERLEQMARGGCGVPECTHKHEKLPLFLRGRCHMKKPIEAILVPEEATLIVRCIQCKRVVVEVFVNLPEGASPDLTPRCHPTSPIQVSYTAGDGYLRVSCNKCDALVAELPVSAAVLM